jgi:hypothetical protein
MQGMGMILPITLLHMMIAMAAGSRCRMIGMMNAPPQTFGSHRVFLPRRTVAPIGSRCCSSSFSHGTGTHWLPFRRKNQYRLSFTSSSEPCSDRSDEPTNENIPSEWSSLDNPSVLDIDDNDTVRERTYQWLRRVVIGLNLCPFAREPTQANQLRIVVHRGNDEDRILETVQEEIEDLVESTRVQTLSGCDPTFNNATTTLLVCPECYPNDFEEYLNIANVIEDAIAEHPEWIGVVQLASFHPLYCFAGSPDPAEPDNCTNQSPYPIFHILREMDVTQAVEQLPDHNAAVVWSRNVDLLRTLKQSLPAAEFQATVTGTQRTSTRVRTILRRFPIPLLRGSGGTDGATNDE